MLHHGLIGPLGLVALTLFGAVGPGALGATAPAPRQDSRTSAPLTPPKDHPGPWITHWADFIRPNAEELRYESIGWRNQFWPAVQLAQELGRPILLWTMNGHPLGCT